MRVKRDQVHARREEREKRETEKDIEQEGERESEGIECPMESEE